MDIRILHVLGDSKFGGASLGILRLAQFWASLGWQVELLATDPRFTEAAGRAGIRVTPLEVIWREIRPARDLAGLARLAAYLRRNRYTAVHTHTTKAGFVGRLAARMAGVPLIVHTAHGFAFHESSPPVKVRFYTALERLASLACDRIVTVSHFHCEWGVRLGIAPAAKLTAIPNGIPHDRVRRPAAEIALLRERFGFPPEATVLFTPGRLVPEKGLEDIVRALPLVNELLNAPCLAALAGDGALRGPLEGLAESLGVRDQVRFLGFRHDIPELLAASDIVVLPSWREGLSISLLEAMAEEKPIVATAIGGNQEALRHGEAAVMVPPGSPRDIADAIFELADNPLLRRHLGQRAGQLFRQNYTLDRMLDGYHRLYLDLLAEKGVAVGEAPFQSLEAHLSASGLLALDQHLRAAGAVAESAAPAEAGRA